MKDDNISHDESGDEEFDEDDDQVEVDGMDERLADELDNDEDLEEDEVPILSSEAIDALVDNSTASTSDATDSICSAAVSPSSKIFAFGSVDEKCRVYFYDQGSKRLMLTHTLTDFTDSVVDVSFNHDGTYLAAGSYDRSIKIYEVSYLDSSKAPIDIKLLHSLDGPFDDIEWIQWHPRGNAIICGSKDEAVHMWWAPTGAPMMTFAGHEGEVNCGKFGNDGRVICNGTSRGSLLVWDPKTGEKKFSVTPLPSSRSSREATLHSGGVVCLDVHESLPLLASGSEDNTVALVNIDNGRMVGVLKGHEDTVESLAFHTNKKDVTLATGGLDGKINIWDCSRLSVKMTFKHLDLSTSQEAPSSDTPAVVGGVTKLSWSPEGKPFLVSASTDCTIRVWDTRSGSCVKILSGHKDTILALVVGQFRQNNRIMFVGSGSDDKRIMLWEIPFDEIEPCEGSNF